VIGDETVIETEAQAFAALAPDFNETREAALRGQIENLRVEVARLSHRPSAGVVVMEALCKVCPWLWWEVQGSDFDPRNGDPAARMEKLLRVILDRAAGGPPWDVAQVWHVVAQGFQGRETRYIVDVSVRNARHSAFNGKFIAALRRERGNYTWHSVHEGGDDPRVLCSAIAAKERLAVLRILSPEQIAAEGAT
jgi:hypothetical protein